MNVMAPVQLAIKEQTPESLYEAARGFLPEIREKARAMSAAGKLCDDLIGRLDAAGLYSVLVPKRWGGAGLGPVEANKIVEILAEGDGSLAWVSGFFILHNMFACRFPMAAQQVLYHDRPSVRAASVWSPPGRAEKVEGGYRLTGKWAYASGIHHASHAHVCAKIYEAGEVQHEGSPYWFIVPREDLQIANDWDMAAMSATGSATITATDVFVPDGWGMEINRVVSAQDHGGADHSEATYRYPFSAFAMLMPSLAIGALTHALAHARGKLSTSKPYGLARLDRSPSRIRWAEAFERLRMITLLRDACTNEALARANAGTIQTLEQEAAVGVDAITVMHGAADAIRSLIDGLGTSIYSGNDPMPRIAADVAMISTHAIGYDYDVLMDRNARWLLGLGLNASDPGYRL